MPKIAYKEVKFKPDSLKLIATCNRIIAEYTAAGFVLTLRQLYYQLVSRDVIANKQTEYKRVGTIINDARLAGLIDWDAMEDRTRNVRSVGHWTSPQSILSAVGDQYRIDKWSDQPVRPEVWIEKDALAGVIEGICTELDISFFSCRGYTSQSEMWSASQRFIHHARRGQATHIIHLGDHDPSGIDMSRDIEERIRDFMRHHLGSARHFKFTRIALNRDQIDQYEPPPNPAKSTDSRFRAYEEEHGDESWELDALEPTVIADLIRSEVDQLRDEDLYAEREATEEEQRQQLVTIARRYDDVVDFLNESPDHD